MARTLTSEDVTHKPEETEENAKLFDVFVGLIPEEVETESRQIIASAILEKIRGKVTEGGSFELPFGLSVVEVVECSCRSHIRPEDVLLLSVVRQNLPKTVCALLQEGADPNCKGRDDDYSALMLACWDGLFENVKALVEGGADVNTSIEVGRNRGGTALAMTAQLGRFEIARYLLQKGANPDVVLHDGTTLLSLAVDGEHHKVAELLRSYLKLL